MTKVAGVVPGPHPPGEFAGDATSTRETPAPLPRHYADHAGVLAVAHHGGAGMAPENTVEAFQSAIDL
jgi:glycerophosphoryl diester phosphodiesterase